MKNFKLVLALLVSLTAFAQANHAARALVKHSIGFSINSDLEVVNLNYITYLTCYSKIGASKGRSFSKKFVIKDNHLYSKAKISDSGYISGRPYLSINYDKKNLLSGTISFTGNVLEKRIQVYTSIGNYKFKCYGLTKFTNLG